MSQDVLEKVELSETEEYLAARLDKAYEDIHHLKRANSKLKNEVRCKNRIISKMKKEKKPDQHYKNGKRGSRFNG